MDGYSITTTLDAGYEDTVELVRAALAKEGFGVLTEIDVKATLKNKLNKDFKNYIILGACNPPFAYRALTVETEIGLFLPCNVIVYETDGGRITVSAVDPLIVMDRLDNPELKLVADELKAKLLRVIDSLVIS